jgi:hypothetical protein
MVTLSCAANAEDPRRLDAEVLWELSRLAPPVVSPSKVSVMASEIITAPNGK